MPVQDSVVLQQQQIYVLHQKCRFRHLIANLSFLLEQQNNCLFSLTGSGSDTLRLYCLLQTMKSHIRYQNAYNLNIIPLTFILSAFESLGITFSKSSPPLKNDQELSKQSLRISPDHTTPENETFPFSFFFTVTSVNGCIITQSWQNCP